MPMQIIRADITKVSADAIVNSANYAPTFARGVDSQIYEAAGAAELLTEREKVGYLEIGDACVTPAFRLNAKYIFHISSPHWIDGNHNEVQLLRQCYDKVLALAVENNCESIAIPLLATGNFRFPQGVGLEVATAAIREFLVNHDLDITLVVFNRRSFTLAKEITNEVKAYIDENYVENCIDGRYADSLDFNDSNKNTKSQGLFNFQISSPKERLKRKRLSKRPCHSSEVELPTPIPDHNLQEEKICDQDLCLNISFPQDTLDDYTSRKFVPFSDHVIQLMNKKGFEKSSDVYKACGMSKQTWAKMMNPTHNPSKTTVMQLCIGLKLNIDEAYDLMMQAGYAFSPNKKMDVIVKYCISKQMDIFDTNNILFSELNITLSNCG